MSVTINFNCIFIPSFLAYVVATTTTTTTKKLHQILEDYSIIFSVATHHNGYVSQYNFIYYFFPTCIIIIHSFLKVVLNFARSLTHTFFFPPPPPSSSSTNNDDSWPKIRIFLNLLVFLFFVLFCFNLF